MSWWVIPEGTAGQVIGQIARAFGTGQPTSGLAGIGSLFTTTQATTRPAGAVDGPYATQQQAQAQATSINTGVTGASTPTVSNLVTSAASGFGIPTLNGTQLRTFVIRVAKVAVGLALVIAGVIQLAHPDKALGTIAKGALLA